MQCYSKYIVPFKTTIFRKLTNKGVCPNLFGWPIKRVMKDKQPHATLKLISAGKIALPLTIINNNLK